MRYILLHGLGQTSQSWGKTLEAAGCGLEFLCPELSEWICGATPTYPDLYRELAAQPIIPQDRIRQVRSYQPFKVYDASGFQP